LGIGDWGLGGGAPTPNPKPPTPTPLFLIKKFYKLKKKNLK